MAVKANTLWKIMVDGPKRRAAPYNNCFRFWLYIAEDKEGRQAARDAAMAWVARIGPSFGEPGPFKATRSQAIEPLSSLDVFRAMGELVRFEAWLPGR